MSVATLKVRVTPRSDALHRVISVCHRRALQIVELRFSGNEITLTITGQERRWRHLDQWLIGLHDVLAVSEHNSGPPVVRAPFTVDSQDTPGHGSRTVSGHSR
jgi:acetolactate synthase regulatory subunit